MTDDPRTICKRCGFANVPGDQFCGSCGAFLEWEGQPADASARWWRSERRGAARHARPRGRRGRRRPRPRRRHGARRTATRSRTRSGPRSPSPTRTTRTATACPTARSSDAPRAGSPTRRTARSASRAVRRSPRRSAGSRSRSPTRWPRRSPGRRRRRRPRSPARRRPPGVGRAVAAAFRRSPASRWSACSSASRSCWRGWPCAAAPRETAAGPSGAPSSAAAGSATPGSSASAAAASPGAASALTLTGATASSVLGDLPRYQAGKAIDGDPKTSWQEGKAPEKNQWIEVAFDPARADTLVIRNGAQASAAQYNGNRRPKDVIVKVGGKSIAVPPQGHDEGPTDRPRRRHRRDVGPDHDRAHLPGRGHHRRQHPVGRRRA